MTDVRNTPEESEVLETLLRALRRQKDEVQLTGCLVRLAGVDAGVGHGLASALLTAASRDPQIGDRARDLLQALPSEVSWKGEEHVVGDTHRVGLKRAQQRGRIDWLLEARGSDERKPLLLLGVEVKIEANVQNPLKEVYYKDLEGRQADAWGLLVLARNRPGDGLLGAEQAHWLGVALWRDVIAELKHVRPSTQTLASVWPVLLGVLSDEDDLGAVEITLESLSTEGARRKLEILAEHAKAKVGTAVADALGARSRGQMAREVVVDISRGSKQSVGLQCFYLDPEEGPAIELKLSVVDGNLHMTSSVEPLALPRRLVRKATRSERELCLRIVPENRPEKVFTATDTP